MTDLQLILNSNTNFCSVWELMIPLHVLRKGQASVARD